MNFVIIRGVARVLQSVSIPSLRERARMMISILMYWLTLACQSVHHRPVVKQRNILLVAEGLVIVKCRYITFSRSFVRSFVSR